MQLDKHSGAAWRQLEDQYVPHSRIEVSKSALLHNLALFKKLSGKQIIPVLKSNAYGHGIQLVASALKSQHLPYIAVDEYLDACRIRQVSEQPVLVMGTIMPANFAHIVYDGFAFAVQDEPTVTALGETGKHIKVHLDCNTGMNRYGALPHEVGQLTKHILRYKNLELEGVMSHLADSDGDDPTTVDMAVKVFDSCVEAVHAAGGRPNIIHLAQSAGSLKARSKYANTMRLGMGLYGCNPFPHSHALHSKLKDLRPALQLVSTLTRILTLRKGDHVGYNYTFTAPKDMIIGVVPFGYYGGLSRALNNIGMVKIGNKTTPIVGKICMNHLMMSLEGITATVGDEVIIYSNQPGDASSIDQIYARHGLDSYNLFAQLKPDVKRVMTP